MKRSILAVITAALLAIAVPAAIAGDYKCDASTQECLDKMAAKLAKTGWLGVKLDHTDDGRLEITEVVPDSPAQAAGLKAGDIFVSMEGVKYSEENYEKMQALKDKQGPGSKVAYTIERNGREKQISAKLAKVPQDVLAQWVGGHMLQHSKVEIAQN